MAFDLSAITEVHNVPVTSSGMGDHELCPRKFLFRHRAGLVPRSRSVSSLRRGHVFHAIIADLLRGGDRDWAESTVTKNLANEIQETLALVSPAGYLPNGKTPEEFVKTAEGDGKVAIAMSRAYAKFFDVQPGSIGGLEVVDTLIESEVRQVIGSFEAGTLDVLVRDPKTGELWVFDHKTCSWDLAQYARTLPLAAQSLLYPMLARTIIAPTAAAKIAGICYGIIKTPTIKCCKTDDFDLTKYAKRVEKWYEDQHTDVMLRTFIRPSHELGKFSAKRLDNVATASISLPVVENFPATGGSACQAYNTLCPYIGLCTRDTTGWPQELERYDRDWRYEEAKPKATTEE